MSVEKCLALTSKANPSRGSARQHVAVGMAAAARDMAALGPASPHLQARLDAVSDCLCVLCAHAGPGAKKALAAQAVTVFDIALPVERALPKVVAWYTRSPKTQRAK